MPITPPKTPWYVYIVRCEDGTLYTGISNDLQRRIAAHNSDKYGAKYTRYRRPVILVYSEKAKSRSEASKREHQLKKTPLTLKKQLIKDHQDVG